MDVRAAIRRTRLPFVASLLLAALLGAPATMESVPAGPVIAAPMIAGRVAESPVAAEPATSVATAADSVVAGIPVEPAHSSVRVLPTGVPLAGAGLADQADRSARAPRAPPAV